jgi:release factor glutamine methyltransferase
MQQSIRSFLEHAYQILTPVSNTPRLEAQVLVGHALGKSRSWVLAHPEAILAREQEQHLSEMLYQLAQGEPLPYLLGRWEFYGLEFLLTPDVLIPRPETELLVEQAITWARSRPAPLLAADVGTGSGCIAISLAVHAPGLHVIASDISYPALRVAHANAVRHQVNDRMLCVQAELLPETSRAYDLVCANLPYIPSPELERLKVRQHEPILALDGGPDGLGAIRQLMLRLAGRLAKDALLLLEIEATLGEAATALASLAFPQAGIHLIKDNAGKDRLLRVLSAGH